LSFKCKAWIDINLLYKKADIHMLSCTGKAYSNHSQYTKTYLLAQSKFLSSFYQAEFQVQVFPYCPVQHTACKIDHIIGMIDKSAFYLAFNYLDYPN
jgi:hypothetical protein